MKPKRILLALLSVAFLLPLQARSTTGDTRPADYVWTTPSRNSSESMPCGGGGVGLNVWVENGDVLIYMSHSGAFDENNTLLKQGRIRLRLAASPLSPSPKGEGKSPTEQSFAQTLKLNDGYVEVRLGDARIDIWCETSRPVVHIDTHADHAIRLEATYETWRHHDRTFRKGESFQTSYKFGAPTGTVTRADIITPKKGAITFAHQNPDSTVFDATVVQQQLLSVKDQLYNPLGSLVSGGMMDFGGLTLDSQTEGTYMGTDFRGWRYAKDNVRENHLTIALYNSQTSFANWQAATQKHLTSALLAKARTKARREALAWWHAFWQRSFIDSEEASSSTSDGRGVSDITRNYTLFRYMMGCNATAEWPTKFNGGLFCFDPVGVGKNFAFTPDYRRWGGGTHTAQNQRLLYWPLLKSGDYDLLPQQLDFYSRLLKTAELRTKVYWNHNGACFTEQLENFGLPEHDEYLRTGQKRPAELEPGLQYNAWLEYTWDTVLEFCQIAFDAESYCGMDISSYVPIAESVLTFFDEHYRLLARRRGIKETDEHGKLVLFPSSGAETYKMAYNATSTCAALSKVTGSLIGYLKAHGADSARIARWEAFRKSVPGLSYRELDGHKVIAPAVVWGRVNNTEPIQLYPVYPWHIYGVGLPDIEVARNTWHYDPFVRKNAGVTSWEQANIWAADLGLADEAMALAKRKLGNGPHRFPAFWGPGHDWTPDHNWGGSGMIGLQEMLVQEAGGKIYLFPAWPKDHNVHFRLHLSQQTTIEARMKDGHAELISITPKAREQQVVMPR